MVYDVIIIGAGPAGMTAALYALRAGRRVLLLEELIYGGQVANTPEVENIPSISRIDGVEFSMNLYNQIVELGAEFTFEGAESVEDKGDTKVVVSNAGQRYEGKTLIIANGAKRRKMEVEGEERFSGRGVSYCATCDGAFFKGQETAVVGGGNTALEDAIYLSALSSRVHLIHRRDTFRGSQILVDRVLALPNVEIHYDCIPQAVIGEDAVTGLSIKNVKTGAIQTLPVSGIFVAVGTVPDNRRFLPLVELDEAGYILAGEDCLTKTPGIFVAGDTRKKHLRQIVTASADGAVAATMAIQHIG
jgi:thioredoxin reductase (NADPH)